VGSDRPEHAELAARLAALAKAVHAADAVPAGKLFGLEELPDGDCWVDIAGAAALTGIKPKTITSWRTRRGPARNPFPVPRRMLYRLYWPRQEIMNWKARQRALVERRDMLRVITMQWRRGRNHSFARVFFSHENPGGGSVRSPSGIESAWRMSTSNSNSASSNRC